MTDFDYAAIDEILHSRVRLAIIAFLAGAKTADFATVRDATKTTDGNASIHLRKLEDAGYVAMQKRFIARKPQTLYSLTERGRRALLAYVAHLEALLPPAILFLIVYLTTANVTVAAAVAITVGLAQIAVQRFTGRRIWPMQWISLLVVIVLSAASIATQSPRFVMLKPSLGHFAIAAAMLKRGWMSRYLPEIAQRYLPANAPVIAGYAWAALMAALGLANILIALYAPFAIWVWFISVGAIGAKVAAFVLQYAVFRAIIRARRRAQSAAIGTMAGPSSALLKG